MPMPDEPCRRPVFNRDWQCRWVTIIGPQDWRKKPRILAVHREVGRRYGFSGCNMGFTKHKWNRDVSMSKQEKISVCPDLRCGVHRVPNVLSANSFSRLWHMGLGCRTPRRAQHGQYSTYTNANVSPQIPFKLTSLELRDHFPLTLP